MTIGALDYEGIEYGDKGDRGQGPPPQSGPDPFAALVHKRWDEGDKYLAAARRDYWINLAFYLGEQWLWWDRQRNMVAQFHESWSPLGPGKARFKANRIRPNTNIVMGRLLKSWLDFEVPPSDSADNAVNGARLGEKVLESYHREQDWESVRYDEVFSAWHGSTSAVCIEWDGQAGKTLQYDPSTEKVIGTGDAYLRAMNCNEFCLEPFVRTWRDARWGIVGLSVPTEFAQDQYKLSWRPESDAGAARSPLHSVLLEGSGRPSGRDQCLVLTYYERPTNKNRKGRYGIVINHRTVYDGPWPFPFSGLNIVPFRQGIVDGRWLGTTLMSDAVELQFAYNFSRSVLQEHLKLTGNARLMYDASTMHEDDLTAEIGAPLAITSNGPGTMVPAYLVPPNLARWVSAEPEAIARELDEVMHVHDTSRGQGYDRASGQALALLSEKDDTPLSIMASEQARNWGYIGSLILKLLEAKSRETRTATIPLVRGVTEAVKWNGKMLQGQTTAHVPLDATMPENKAARMAFWKDLWDRKIVSDPRQYAKAVGLPPEDFEQLLDPDAASAHRENYRMIQGYTVLPEDFEDHPIHMAEHNRFRKTDAYRYADREQRSIVDDHIKFHEKLMHEEVAGQVQRAQINPALAAIPQGHAPAGAVAAPTGEEMNRAAAMQMDGAGGGQMQLPPGGTTPALASGQPGG